MAQVLYDPNKDIYNQPTQNTTLSTSQSPFLSAQPQGQGQEEKRAGTGRFQGLQKFIQENQGEAQKSAEKTAQQAQQIGEQTQQAIQEKQKQAAQIAQSEAQRLNQAGNIFSQVKSDPRQVNAGQFGQLKSGQYAQNINLGDISQQQQNLADLQQRERMAGNEAGRFELLKQVVNPQKQYSQSAQRLDRLLLESDPLARQKLMTGIQQAAQQTGQTLSSAEQNLQQQQADIASKAAQASGQAQESLSELGGYLENVAKGRAQNYNVGQERTARLLQRAMAGSPLTQQESESLFSSLDPESIKYLSGLSGKTLGYSTRADMPGINPEDIVNQIRARNLVDVSSPTNLSKFATQEEAEKAKALQNLGYDKQMFPAVDSVGSLINAQYTPEQLGLTGTDYTADQRLAARQQYINDLQEQEIVKRSTELQKNYPTLSQNQIAEILRGNISNIPITTQYGGEPADIRAARQAITNQKQAFQGDQFIFDALRKQIGLSRPEAQQLAPVSTIMQAPPTYGTVSPGFQGISPGSLNFGGGFGGGTYGI